MAYLAVGLNFPYNYRFKNAPEPQNGGHFKHFEIFEIGFYLTADIEKALQIMT